MPRLRTLPACALALLILSGCAATAPGPATPSGLVAVVGDGEVLLRWNPNGDSDLDHYNIYLEADGGLRTAALERIAEVAPDEDRYRVTGLDNGTPYTFAIDAENGQGLRSSKATVEATPSSTPTPSPTAPEAPTGLGIVIGPNGNATLSWDANGESDLDRYRIYQELVVDDGATTQAFDRVAEVPAGSESISLNRLVHDSAYRFAISAVNDGDEESALGEAVEILAVDVTPPSAPTGLDAVGGDAQAVLTWDAGPESDLTHVEVRRGLAADALDAVDEIPAGIEIYTATPLANSATYYFALVAVDTSGNRSDPSATVDAATKLAPLRLSSTTLSTLGQQLFLQRNDAPALGAIVTMNGDDIPFVSSNSFFAQHAGDLSAGLVPGSTLDIGVEQSATIVTGSTVYPHPTTADSLAGDSYSRSEVITVSWTNAVDPDGFELLFRCFSGDCFPTGALAVEVAGDKRTLLYPASNLVANSSYDVLIRTANRVDDWVGDVHPESLVEIRQAETETGSFEVTP
jgi:hypothetical protein